MSGTGVLRGVEELVELGALLRVVGELGLDLGGEILAMLDGTLVLDHRIVVVGHVDVASDVAQRDRRVLPPRHVGDVVDGVTAPAEVVQVLVQLVEERTSLVGLGQLRGEIAGMVLVEQLVQRGTVAAMRLSRHRPWAASTGRVW